MATHTDEKLELLKRVPLFAGLGRKEIEEIGRLAEEIDVPAGRVLMREGQTGQEFFVIVEGNVLIERGGRELRTLGAGDFLGEIALVDDGPRTATATVETNAALLVLAHREFHSLMDQFPSVRTAVLQALAMRVRQLEPDAAH
jgi:CRP/FNR family transcriptional regulator, cyclic AMP receptor protein